MPLLNTGSDASIAADALISAAFAIRSQIDTWKIQCDAQSINAFEFLNGFMMTRLTPMKTTWDANKAVSGVQAVLRQRFPGKYADDGAVDTDLTAASTAIQTLMDYIVTNVQNLLTNGSGYVDCLKIVNSAFQARIINNATQCANLKAALQALRNAISS